MASEKLQIQSQLAHWLLRRTPAGGVRRIMPIAAAIASELGNVRTENQDRAVVAKGKDKHGYDYAIVALADGIGGMRGGASCAALTIAGFVSALASEARTQGVGGADWIRRAALAADNAVFSWFRGDGGATLAALVICPGRNIHWISVGDSRVYSATGKNLSQLSTDDTIAGQLGKSHEAAFEQSKLLQFVGMGSDLEPHISEIGNQVPDSILLTTDGIHYLSSSPNWLGQIVGNAADPGTCVKRLAELAKWCGGPDNATVAMVSLSANWENEPNSTYAFLEVWDAFGELQILYGNHDVKVEPPRSKAGEISSPPAVLSDVTPDSPVKVKPPKSGRKSRDPSRKKNNDPADNHDDPPQLSMTFPTKESKQR